MKHCIFYKRSLLALFLVIVLSSFAQQQITHTATKENNSCNYDCTILDIPELNNNPLAILFVTPSSEKGGTLNQHPIGAYYFKEKWHIFNLDSRPIPAGSKFTVTYFTDPDEKHFQYSFKREDIQPDGSALIDHPSLNGNPGAKFTSFPRWDPNSAGGITNRDEIKTEYNAAAGKWAFSNKNQKPLYARVTYNISVEDAGAVTGLPMIDTPRISQPLQPILPVGTVTTMPYPPVDVVTTTPNPPVGKVNTTPGPNAISGDLVILYMSGMAGNTKLTGDSKVANYQDFTELLGLDMGTSNMGGTKNNYDPIVIRLHSGSAMFIELLNAYISKQSMTFQIDAMSNSTTGKYAKNFTLRLTGAKIVGFKEVYLMEPNYSGTSPQTKRTYDEIKVVFTNIEYTNSAGTTATDNF